MNVAQLIAELEAIEDKTKLVYVKDGDTSGGCCNSGDPDWDELISVDETMIQQRDWSKPGAGWKSINVVKLDVY